MLLVLLLFTPMILEIVFVNDIFLVARRAFAFWENIADLVFLSDLLFIEAAVLILLGALIAGVILYTSWASADIRQIQFTESIWNWRRIKEERNSATGLAVGLCVLFVGVVYVVVAVAISLPTFS